MRRSLQPLFLFGLIFVTFSSHPPTEPCALDDVAFRAEYQELHHQIARQPDRKRALPEAKRQKAAAKMASGDSAAAGAAGSDAAAAAAAAVAASSSSSSSSSSSAAASADAESSEPTSILHIKNPYDYQGRSFLFPPAGHRARPPDQCFLPKYSGERGKEVGRLLHQYKGHERAVSAIRFFPGTGHLLLSAGMDSKVKLWGVGGLHGYSCIRTYLAHTQVREV